MGYIFKGLPQVGVLADLCCSADRQAQVSEYRDLVAPHSARLGTDGTELSEYRDPSAGAAASQPPFSTRKSCFRDIIAGVAILPISVITQR
jgi:hypothetical protein